MSMFTTLMVAAVIAGQSDAARSWIKPLDYPVSAMRESRGGVTGFELTFSEQGSPIRCEISYPSGWDDLDQATCKLLPKRGRMTPARDAEGRPIAFVYRSTHRWFVQGMEQKRPNPPRHDLEEVVDHLPVGVTGQARVEVAFLVDTAGKISECSAMKPSARPGQRRFADDQRASAALWNEACRRVTADARPTPARDAAGQPIVSVQTLRVGFRDASAPVSGR